MSSGVMSGVKLFITLPDGETECLDDYVPAPSTGDRIYFRDLEQNIRTGVVIGREFQIAANNRTRFDIPPYNCDISIDIRWDEDE